MALGINTNIAGINNRNSLNRLESPLQSTFQQLSSGKQINSARDNAAAMAIVERFASQIMGAAQGYQNINDGISMTQVADGYASSITDLTQRARELAMQSSNGLMSDSDRAALQAEYSQIQEEVRRITGSAEFNGQKLFSQDGSLSLQVDSNAGDTISVNTYDMNSRLSDFLNSDISTQQAAQNSLDAIDTGINNINTVRADYGAISNRLESAAENLLNKQVNLEASRSRIEDTDYAKATSELTKNLMLRDASIAMQGYTNFSQNQVMSLLGTN